LGESLSGLDLSGTSHSDAGSYGSDGWTFTDSTGNYNDAGRSVSDSIAKANATILVAGFTGVYDGQAHGATGSATGVLGEDLGSLLNLGASFTNVPGGTANWSFAGNIDYNAASGSASIVISPAAASKLVYQQAPPASGTAGVALAPAVTVAVEDPSGNVVTSDNSTVTLTLSSGTFANGSTTATATAVNGVATFSSLMINKTGSYKLTASDGTLTTATSGSVVISAAAASQLVYRQAPPATGTAGAAFSVKVAVADQFGNVVTSDTSTVTLALSSGTFSTGSNTATAVASSGIATFSLVINTAGTYSLAASDASLTGTVSGNITINAAAANKLVFQQTPPATGTAGVALSPAVTVAVEDKFGNIVTTNNSTVTLTLSGGAKFSTGSSTASVAAVNGIATFSNLIIITAGTFTMAASDGTLTKATSGSVVINAVAASKLAFLQVPTTGTHGVALSTIQVAVEDQFGNIVTSDNSTITISVATGPAGGGFTATSTTTVQVVNGIATFTNLILTKAGTYTLRAVDGSLTSATSGSIAIK
jgi:hypothetical protein